MNDETQTEKDPFELLTEKVETLTAEVEALKSGSGSTGFTDSDRQALTDNLRYRNFPEVAAQLMPEMNEKPAENEAA